MGGKDSGQNAPHSVHLAVILIDFGDDEEDRDSRNGKGQARDRGIGGDVERFQRFRAVDGREQSVREIVELGQEVLEGRFEVRALR